MPEPRAIAPALRELDRTLADRGMPPGARSRVAASLAEEAVRRKATSGFRFRWLPALTFAAGAALVMLVVGLQLGGGTTTTRELASPSVMGMFSVQGQGCRHHESGDQTVLDGDCRLVAPHLAVHTWERVRIRGGREVRLLEGLAMFEVTTVEPGDPPTRIHVSHGTIEVLGTRFTIEQQPGGGYVDLFEGRVRFVDLQGEATDIAPGQRHYWGSMAALAVAPEASAPGRRTASRAASASAAIGTASQLIRAEWEPAAGAETETTSEAETAPSARGKRQRARTKRSSARTGAAPPAETRPVGTSDEAAAIIEEVTRLRSKGHYREAAGALRRAENARRWDRRTAQVLSYERGEILERHLGDREATCAHWARHQRRFPNGRYSRAVTAARERLRCNVDEG